MTTTTTFGKIATEFFNALEKRTRTDGIPDSANAFYTLRDGSPEWMRDAIHAAHDALDGRMPDDWTYSACRGVLSEIDEEDSADDVRERDGEIADRQTNDSTHRLCVWLASHVGNVALCDEALDEGLCDGSATITQRIALGQYLAYTRILDTLVRAIEAQADERDAANDDSAEDA